MIPASILITGARQNNLKNISVTIPARRLSVITGLSGSGKSSLAFETLYAEGQRRYIESLSTYTRQFLEKMPRPDIDSITNLPPAIALEQKNHVLNSRSTVATQTEIVDYLRILFARAGQTFCVDCGAEVKKLDSALLLEWALQWLPGRKAWIVAPAAGVAPASASPKKTKGKPKKQNPKKGWLEGFVGLLKEQGFQRVLRKHARSIEVLELEEPLPGDVELDELFIVVDRLKMSAAPDEDARARLLDSIDQALAIGAGRMVFCDLDAPHAQEWHAFDQRFACTTCGREHRKPEPQLFSFNNPLGACPQCSGFGFTLDLDESLIIPDPSKTLKNGAIDPLSKPSLSHWQDALFRFCEHHGISIGKRYVELNPAQKKLIWEGDGQDKKFQGIFGCFEELKRKKYKLHVRVFIRRYQNQTICSGCKGSRLQPEALAVKIQDASIHDVLQRSIQDALNWVQSLNLNARQKKISREAFAQVERRLHLLQEVGVGYLTLSRLTKTLSGGEFQRINLATQLGNGLCGTLYILDEPSIGLHAADTEQLIGVLKRLRDQGNTVVIVEHDLEVMRAADWIVELGPAAGKKGGALMAQGTAQTVVNTPASITGKYLGGDFRLASEHPRRPPAEHQLRLVGCRENNLKNLTVEFPLRRMVVVTGVSGSGKSTLVHKTLYQALSRHFYRTAEEPGKYERLYGAEHLHGVVLLDQTPIGKSSRSNPATYLKAWEDIRRLYAQLPLSLRRGYSPQHFSFNVDGGRCPVCKGEGEITLDMHFMAEMKLPCEECQGRRFKKSILEVEYRGKNVSDLLLRTTIDEAFELFHDLPSLRRKLSILRDVGLGYLQLGQSSTQLSGGEAQRLKIAGVLEDSSLSNLLYIFDEPTTGLHLEDIRKLLRVMQDLVDAGHSVILIEHHLDVIAQADWVIDLGPGGGTQGGTLLASGSPDQLMTMSDFQSSKTAPLLKRHVLGLEPT